MPYTPFHAWNDGANERNKAMFKHRKVGGIRFFRIGSFQFSFCRISAAKLAKERRAVAGLPGRVTYMTPEQAAAYRAEWAAHCDRMSAGY